MTAREELRARFLARSNPKPVRKTIPGFGEVFLRVLTVEQADKNRAISTEFAADSASRANARRLAMMLVDEDGEDLFDARDDDDVDALQKLDLELVNGLFRDGTEANTLEQDKDEDGGNG